MISFKIAGIIGILISSVPFIFAATTAAPFVYFNKSAALAGWGNPDTVFAEYPTTSGNPALYGVKPPLRLSFAGGEDGNGASLNRLSFDTRIKKTGLGVSFFGYSYEFKFINLGGFESNSVNYVGHVFSIASGFQLYKNLYAGLALEKIDEELWVGNDVLENSAPITNIGLFFKSGRFNAGLLQKNIGESEFPSGDPLPKPARLSFGWGGEKLKAALTVGGDPDYTGLGFEWCLSDWFFLRAGMESTGDDVDASPTFGFGLRWGSFGFDFSAARHPDLGATTLSALNYSWGVKKAAKAPAPKKEPKPAPAPAPAAPSRRRVPPAETSKMPEVPEGEKINIAVTDFEARAPLSQSEAAFISDFVRSDVVKTGRFNVIDKNNMDKVLAEQGFQQTGCSTAECAVQIGKILNVKMMAVGSCGQLLGKYIITMNIIDVESAKIIFSDDVSVANPDDLRKTITELIGNFIGSVK